MLNKQQIDSIKIYFDGCEPDILSYSDRHKLLNDSLPALVQHATESATRMADLEKANIAMQLALELVIKNDKTVYKHHERRPFDNKTPEENGGTIWLTPKEIALDTLKALGIRPPYGTD